MFNKIKSFFIYIKKSLFERSFQPILKLSHITYSKRLGYEICIVQVIGKNIFSEFEAQYLITQPRILNGFSHQDVVRITLLAAQIKNALTQKSYHIREMHSYHSPKKNIVIVEQIGEPASLKAFSLSQIEENKELLNRFTSNEAFVLGHAKATIDILEEQEMIKKIKLKNLKSNIIDLNNSAKK